jgi:hypothetical protein
VTLDHTDQFADIAGIDWLLDYIAAEVGFCLEKIRKL